MVLVHRDFIIALIPLLIFFLSQLPSQRTSFHHTHMSTNADPYSWDIGRILNITPSSSEKEITIQYHKLVKQYHPDKTDDPSSTELYLQVKTAYDFIKDSTNRHNYWKLWTLNQNNSNSVKPVPLSDAHPNFPHSFPFPIHPLHAQSSIFESNLFNPLHQSMMNPFAQIDQLHNLMFQSMNASFDHQVNQMRQMHDTLQQCFVARMQSNLSPGFIFLTPTGSQYTQHQVHSFDSPREFNPAHTTTTPTSTPAPPRRTTIPPSTTSRTSSIPQQTHPKPTINLDNARFDSDPPTHTSIRPAVQSNQPQQPQHQYQYQHQHQHQYQHEHDQQHKHQQRHQSPSISLPNQRSAEIDLTQDSQRSQRYLSARPQQPQQNSQNSSTQSSDGPSLRTRTNLATMAGSRHRDRNYASPTTSPFGDLNHSISAHERVRQYMEQDQRK